MDRHTIAIVVLGLVSVVGILALISGFSTNNLITGSTVGTEACITHCEDTTGLCVDRANQRFAACEVEGGECNNKAEQRLTRCLTGGSGDDDDDDGRLSPTQCEDRFTSDSNTCARHLLRCDAQFDAAVTGCNTAIGQCIARCEGGSSGDDDDGSSDDDDD